SIEQVAKHMIDATSIRIFGMGVSGLVGEDLYYKLLRIGKTVFHNRDAHVQLTYASNMKQGDVAVLISYSGITSEVLELLDIAKKTGATTVVITKYAKNDFTSRADYVLHTSTPEIDMRSGATSSRIAQLTIVDVLFTAIASKEYQNIETNLQSSYEICKPHKKK
ncbi:MAG: SIS domain-containing protein, partial [Oscillospiraceae bacterium]